MNANNCEVSVPPAEGLLIDSSSPEEPGPKAIMNPKSLEFLQQFFPLTNINTWNDWRWQLRHTFTSAEMLSQVMKLTQDEVLAINRLKECRCLPLRVSPYYLSLIYDSQPGDPLRRTMIPSTEELILSEGESSDPLNEMGTSPVTGIVHRYPDRALFTVTQCCSSYCRYCTRSHSVGRLGQLTKNQWINAINYLKEHEEIRDVVISGGDPLTLDNEHLEFILSSLRAIEHIEILRIGTKVPMVLPMRITRELTNILKKYHPLFVSIHCTHPDEITPESKHACEMLADAGMPLGSQTVLLKGINNDPVVMKRLMQKLLMSRVRPYYIYQCDPIPGSGHFRTPIEEGINIIENLRGHTSGYAVPQFVVDAPGGGGKIPLLPDYVVESGPEKWVLRNYKKKLYEYPNGQDK